MASPAPTPHSDRYRVVPRTLSFLTSEKDVLLLQGAEDKPLFAGLYNGVGGHVEADEDVYAAARREIREETGIDVPDLVLRGVVNVPVGDATGEGVLLFVFRGRAASREVRHSAEGTLAWVPPHAFDTLPLVEDLPLLLPRVLAGNDRDPPFFAHYARGADARLIAHFSP